MLLGEAPKRGRPVHLNFRIEQQLLSVNLNLVVLVHEMCDVLYIKATPLPSAPLRRFTSTHQLYVNICTTC